MSLRMGSNQGHAARTNILDKKIPRNPRYADIQSKVKTGMTVDKLTFVTTRQHLRRQEEPYYRLSPSQLHELFSEYEQDRQEGVQDFRDHIDPDHHGPRVVVHEADATPSYERPYLILDVRTPEEFRQCHITQARSFEGKLLNQDHMTPELYRYRNKEGGLVVLYCNEEREACHAAATLIHRGFDNVFVLSTGITGFVRRFQSFVEGDTKALPSTAGTEMSSTTSRRPRRRVSGDGGCTSARNSTNGSARGGSTIHGNGLYGAMTSTNSGARSMNGSTVSSINNATVGGGRRRSAPPAANGYGSNSLATTVDSVDRATGAPNARANNAHHNGVRSGSSDIVHTLQTKSASTNVIERNDGHRQQVQQRVSARESIAASTATTSNRQSASPTSATKARQENVEPRPGRSQELCSHRRLSPRSSPCGREEAYDIAEGRGGRSTGGGEALGVSNAGRSLSGRAGSGEDGGLAEAAVAASAARRRSLGSSGDWSGGQRRAGGRGVEESRGSAVTVADSVISRATARRGRW